MLKATKGRILPTTMIGSLPRPSWYSENLGTRSFVEAMASNKFREQYTDALSVYLRDQEVAGLDIVTDGDCRFDQDVGGQTWTSGFVPPVSPDLPFTFGDPSLAADRDGNIFYASLGTDAGLGQGIGLNEGF